MRNCIDVGKKKGAKNIGDDFITEANRLSEEKLAVELEKTKVQMDINYREGVVADKQIIADSLKKFGSVVRSLPEADQKELVQLIIKEVSVKHFDPEIDPTPRKTVCLKRKSELNGIWLTFQCSQVTYFQQVFKLGK